jgi:type VI secretion system protein ImpH
VATESRKTDPSVIDQILAEGSQFSFFQVVRLLQRMNPDAAPVGRQGPPDRECLRFQPMLNFGFSAADVSSVHAMEVPQGGMPRYEVSTTFLGLYGSPSPLPSFFTEQLLDESSSPLARGLLDLFHHRLLSLFYRIWERYRLVPSPEGRAGDLTVSQLLHLLGFDEKTSPVPPEAFNPWDLLAVSGLAAQQPRSATALAAILQHAFPDIHAEIEQCVGRWVDVPPGSRSRLDRANCRLGHDITLGERVFTRHYTFRVILGPIAAGPFFQLLLPGGALMNRLREIIALFNVDGLDYEVEVQIRPDAIPEMKLGNETARLGWSAWLGRRPDANCQVRFLTRGWTHA